MENLEFIEEVLEQEQKYSEILPTSDELVYETYEFCDEQCLEDCTISAVQEFYEADLHRIPPYEEASVEQRAQYLTEFHDNFSMQTGYANNLHFVNDMNPRDYGAFNPYTKRIDINANLLKDDDTQEIMNTIMHESRHAYQHFAVKHPELVSVDMETIKKWEDNFNNYIRPEFDIEEYQNQPVEADANDFAERMYNEGLCNVA